jgi:dihydrofolate reductase
MPKTVKIKIYETIILPVVLYGRETWSLIPREGHKLGVFENKVLRRIPRTKRDEI